MAAVKSTGYSNKRHRFESQPQYDDSKPAVSLVPSALRKARLHMMHEHAAKHSK